MEMKKKRETEECQRKPAKQRFNKPNSYRVDASSQHKATIGIPKNIFVDSKHDGQRETVYWKRVMICSH